MVLSVKKLAEWFWHLLCQSEALSFAPSGHQLPIFIPSCRLSLSFFIPILPQTSWKCIMTAEIDANDCLVWLFCEVSCRSNKSRKAIKNKKVIFLTFYPLHTNKNQKTFYSTCSTWPLQIWSYIVLCNVIPHDFLPQEMENAFVHFFWRVMFSWHGWSRWCRDWISKLKHSLGEVTIHSTMIIWICSSQLWSQCGFLYIKHLYTILRRVFISTERPLKHNNSW